MEKKVKDLKCLQCGCDLFDEKFKLGLVNINDKVQFMNLKVYSCSECDTIFDSKKILDKIEGEKDA